MIIIQQGNLNGEFTGFCDWDTVFEFTNGRKWRQNEYRYHYRYAYRPKATVYSKGGTTYISVDGASLDVKVVRAD